MNYFERKFANSFYFKKHSTKRKVEIKSIKNMFNAGFYILYVLTYIFTVHYKYGTKYIYGIPAGTTISDQKRKLNSFYQGTSIN